MWMKGQSGEKTEHFVSKETIVCYCCCCYYHYYCYYIVYYYYCYYIVYNNNNNNWKAVEEYFTLMLLVFQFTQSVILQNLSVLDLALSGMKRLSICNVSFNGNRTHNLHVSGTILYQLSYEAIHVGSWSILGSICPCKEYSDEYLYIK